MILERFFDDALAQASYLVGAETTDAAIVIDPNRDVDQYLDAASRRKLRITHVTETHIHADFVSGARVLARQCGARLLLSGEGGSDWQYRVAPDDAAVLLMDGDSFQIGEVRFDVLHTPGHTPEHVVLLTTDGATADRPMGVFTGDFIFVNDVGRPDLLERAAGLTGTMESSARALFQSLRRMRAYPDYLQLWPGHGAGSACGKSLGAVPASTLGYERLFNWAFTVESEDDFVRAVLAGQPEPPRYFARMKRINRDGAPTSAVELPREPIDAAALARLLETRSATVIDARPPARFASGFIPGSLNIPWGKSFATWAGSLLDEDRDLVLLLDDVGEREEVEQARVLGRALGMVGLERVRAWGGAQLFAQWASEGKSLERMSSIDASALAEQVTSSALQLVDVRGDAEWEAGHIPGAMHLFLGDLPLENGRLSNDQPIVVTCQGGTRSAIAASLLRARGFANVTNFPGGFAEWERHALPVVRSEVSAETP